MTTVPSYDQLPRGSAWEVWPDRPELGCLNLIDEAATLRGLAAARRGVTFRLDLPLDEPSPPLFGRAAFRHEVRSNTSSSADDLLHDFNTQSSTQWDGFRHVRHPLRGAVGGIDEAAHGIHHWADVIVTRGVVVDVATHRATPPDTRHPITVEDLESTLAAQGTTVEPGDLLLLRTGWVGWYLTQDDDRRAALPSDLVAPGLAPGEDMARFLWDLHVCAIATDNPAVEAWPPTGRSELTPEQLDDPAVTAGAFLHFNLLGLLGLPLGELFQLDDLAADCAEEGDWTCLVTSAPLRVPNGVASPPNALAVR